MRGWEGEKVRSNRDRVLNSECGMRNAERNKENGRQSFEFGVRNAARPGATASIKWHQSGTKVLNEQ